MFKSVAKMTLLVNAAQKDGDDRINARDGRGDTMLHHALRDVDASHQDSADVVVFLMKRNADPCVPDSTGKSAADLILSSGPTGPGAIPRVVAAIFSHQRRVCAPHPALPSAGDIPRDSGSPRTGH